MRALVAALKHAPRDVAASASIFKRLRKFIDAIEALVELDLGLVCVGAARERLVVDARKAAARWNAAHAHT